MNELININISDSLLLLISLYIILYICYFVIYSFFNKNVVSYYKLQNNKSLLREESKSSIQEIDVSHINPSVISSNDYNHIYQSKPITTADELLNNYKTYVSYNNGRVIKYNGKLVDYRPRVIVCHDMNNNYLTDSLVYGSNYYSLYPFQLFNWRTIDIFIYFSHNLITIPPVTWINNCHKHNTLILGTFITEWGEGRAICNQLFHSSTNLSNLVDIFIHLMNKGGFDGWLINIENQLDITIVENAITFIQLLTTRSKIYNSNSLVIWYDAVTIDGELKWQNELSIKNYPMYEACDGIFINYTWTSNNLSNSIKLSTNSDNYNIYFGIDVFGRGGSEHPGEYLCYQSIQRAFQSNVSIALFAPGWIIENQLSNDLFDYLMNSLRISTESHCNMDNCLVNYLSNHSSKNLTDDFIRIQNKNSRYMNELFMHIDELVGHLSIYPYNYLSNKLASNQNNNLITNITTKDRTLLTNYVSNSCLHLSFSQSAGRYIFVSGFKFNHPSRYIDVTIDSRIVNKVVSEVNSKLNSNIDISTDLSNELTSYITSNIDSYYDLNLQDLVVNKNSINKTYVSNQSSDSFIRLECNFNNGYDGSSSLSLTGVLTTISDLTIYPYVVIPLIETQAFTNSSIRRSIVPLVKLGNTIDPIRISFTLACSDSCEIALLLTFRDFNSNSNNKNIKNQIVLTNSSTNDITTYKSKHLSNSFNLTNQSNNKLTWCKSSKSICQFVDQLNKSKSSYIFEPSNITIDITTDSQVYMPDSKKIFNYLNCEIDKSVDSNIDSYSDDCKHLQSMIDNNNDEIMKAVPWQKREYLINPVSLTNLRSRDLMSIEIIAYNNLTSAKSIEQAPYRAYIGYINISYGKDCIPTDLAMKSNIKIDNKSDSTMDSKIEIKAASEIYNKSEGKQIDLFYCKEKSSYILHLNIKYIFESTYSSDFRSFQIFLIRKPIDDSELSTSLSNDYITSLKSTDLILLSYSLTNEVYAPLPTHLIDKYQYNKIDKVKSAGSMDDLNITENNYKILILVSIQLYNMSRESKMININISSKL